MNEIILNTPLINKLNEIAVEVIEKGKDPYGDSWKITKWGMWKSGIEVLKEYPDLEEDKERRGGDRSKSQTPPRDVTFAMVGEETNRSKNTIKNWVDLVKRISPEPENRTNEIFEAWLLPACRQVVEAWANGQKAKLLTDETYKRPILPEGIFQVIYADPPWEYDNTGFPMSVEQHYPTLPLEDIKNYTDSNGKHIREIIADDAVLFLWTTNPLLKDAQEVIEAWGFEYKTNMVWVKKNHTAGFYVFGQHEQLLISVRGSMLPPGEKPKSVVYGENKVHSQKPDIFYDIIEKMYPGYSYCEGFQRTPKPGWIGFGNE